ncbi:MAG: hypothetical protein HC822_17770 [Oscillochloris sp.]|nr:hypothetical protein [Oscillochloris sp.]
MTIQHPARLLLLVLALLVLPVVPARAQQESPLTVEVQAGYGSDGTYRVGHWFPVTVIAANSGADLNGVLEFRFPGGEQSVFRYRVDLPRGARKQVTLPVTSNEAVRGAEIAFVGAEGDLLRQTVRLNPISFDEMLLGVVSSVPGALNSLGAIRSPTGGTASIAPIDPVRLPGDPLLLAGFDTIFLHDPATADFTSDQISALREYVALGGLLVVGGGPASERTVPGVVDLLPVDVGQLQQAVSAQALATYAGVRDSQPPALTVNTVAQRPRAVALDRDGLITSIDYGDGQVLFSAFELTALRGWGGEADLWQRALDIEGRVLVGSSFRTNNENLLRDALRLQALNLPSPLLLLALIVIYIVIIGPLNFLFLRRLGRVELAWVTTPILVVLFLGVAYGASFVLRGVRPQIAQVAVVQGISGNDRGVATAFIGVFSPQRRSYELQFAPETLVTPGSFEGFRLRSVPVTGDDTSIGMEELLVDVSALRTLMVEQSSVALPELSSSLNARGAAVQGGTIRNESALTLNDVLVVRGDAVQEIGDLAPGASVEFDLVGNPLSFPNQISLGEDGVVMRDAMLYNLFGYGRFHESGMRFQGEQGFPDRLGVYVLAWGDTPAVDFTINGAAVAQEGRTLYIIRLQP